MIDAYEIGIQLALQDDVSAGLEVINRGLAEVDRAIDATSAKLANLQAAEAKANIATSGTAMRPTAGPADKMQENSLDPASATSTPVGSAIVAPVDSQAPTAPAATPAEPTSAALRPSTAPSAGSEQSRSDANFPSDRVALPSVAPPLDQGSPPSVVHVEHSMKSAAPGGSVQPATALEGPSGRATAGPERSVQVLSVANAPGVAPDRVENAGPVREDRFVTASIAQASAPSSANRAGEAVTISSGEVRERSSDIAVRAAAPWSGVESRALSPRPEAASQRTAAPQGRQQEGADGLTGTVMLDGHLVGYWLAEQMAKDASRPPSGTSFFDPRQTPAWTASGSL